MPESESARLRRALRIILLLSQQKKGLSVYDIAEREEIGVRSIRRDIALLRDEGLPIEEALSEHGKKLWRITAKVDEISFSYHELLSLFLGRRLLEPFVGTPLFEGPMRPVPCDAEWRRAESSCNMYRQWKSNAAPMR